MSCCCGGLEAAQAACDGVLVTDLRAGGGVLSKCRRSLLKKRRKQEKLGSPPSRFPQPSMEKKKIQKMPKAFRREETKIK